LFKIKIKSTFYQILNFHWKKNFFFSHSFSCFVANTILRNIVKIIMITITIAVHVISSISMMILIYFPCPCLLSFLLNSNLVFEVLKRKEKKEKKRKENKGKLKKTNKTRKEERRRDKKRKKRKDQKRREKNIRTLNRSFRAFLSISIFSFPFRSFFLLLLSFYYYFAILHIFLHKHEPL